MTDFNDPNPYTTPNAVTSEPASIAALGPARPWAAFDAIEFGWNAIRRAPLIIVLLVIAGMVSAIPDMVGGGLQAVLTLGQREEFIVAGIAVRGFLLLVGLGLGAWVALGKNRVKLKVCRGGEAHFEEIFAGGPLASMLGAIGLIVLAVLVGVLVFMGPGFALMFIGGDEETGGIVVILGGLVLGLVATLISWKVQFFSFLIVDRGAGAVQSLTTSWRMTDGHMLGLFVFWLLMIAVVIVAMIVGTLACLIGLIVTVPTALAVLALAQAYIYLKLTGEEPALTTG